MASNNNWKSDGSSSWTEEQLTNTNDNNNETKNDNNSNIVSSSVLRITAGNGSPTNFLHIDDDNSFPHDSYYFQARILSLPQSSHISVGVALESEFKPGYKIKGMFYNGNLTNGGTALKTGFGPYIKEGDTIGIEYYFSNPNREEEKMVQIMPHVNNVLLGLAFQIPKPSESNNKKILFYPCLSVTGNVTVETKVYKQKPKNNTNDIISSSSSSEYIAHPIEGKWKVVNATKDGTTFFPLVDATRDISLQFSCDKNQNDNNNDDTISFWNVSMRVSNSLTTQMKCNDNSSSSSNFVLTGSSGVSATRMMARPPWRNVEALFTSFLSSPTINIEKDGNNTIILTASTTNRQGGGGGDGGGNDSEFIVKCEQFQASMTEPACTSYK